MPDIQSKAQFGAMQAAKAGNSTLGIPKKVGSQAISEYRSAGGDASKLPAVKKSKPSGDARKAMASALRRPAPAGAMGGASVGGR